MSNKISLSLLLIFLSVVPSLLLPLDAALLIPIKKDHTYRQYTTTISLKTPLQPVKLFLDLGATITWVDCYTNYTSSTYRHVSCFTPFCDSLGSYTCNLCEDKPSNVTCAPDMCTYYAENSVTRQFSVDPLLIDTLALPTTDGSKQGPLTTLDNYLFSCARQTLVRGLAKNVSGMLALGRSEISLPAQVTSAISAPACFALCLSGSRDGQGVGFIGSRGPYVFSPGIDVSKSLVYTPLLTNPRTLTVFEYQYPSNEYFINLTSIKVNNRVVPINRTQLVIDAPTGNGGTKISTSVTYTTLETTIYKAFTSAFLAEASAMNLGAVKSIRPFEICYDANRVPNTRTGPAFPRIDFALSGNVNWRIFGANSMVQAVQNKAKYWCLGFKDGGFNPRTPIVIGGYQMEDNLLQFDLESQRLGLSSTLLLKGTSCANFNFKTANKKP